MRVEQLWDLLREVKDPELPMLDIVEMGIVREVVIVEPRVRITVTPTYSGCPAMDVIEGSISALFEQAGIPGVEIERSYAPPWTTDWLTTGARDKLRAMGVEPPGARVPILDFVPVERLRVQCPYCRSTVTELRSEFGSTPCKSMYFCKACIQPFEYFKVI